MLMTVEELKKFIQTDEPDELLQMRLDALEIAIRRFTNNNFQNRGERIEADIRGGVFMSESLIPFDVGDTIMISDSDLQSDCLCTVKEITDDITFTVNESVADDDYILLTKVEYPKDVKFGAVGILRWQMKNEAANSGDKSKQTIQSETISRYSVTYASDRTEDDLSESFGVPRKYVAFLEPYRKARF